MKIAIIGYGKMGRTIERLAEAKGHEIVLTIDADNAHQLTDGSLQAAEVAIEFSRPESAVTNIQACLKQGVPVVSGTTGWLKHWDAITELCEQQQGAFFYASNYSIGVNIFFEINKHLARLMKGQDNYKVFMEEIHHIHKLDAPSGTAITLAEGIINNHNQLQDWYLKEDEEVDEARTSLPIAAKREGEVHGTHIIRYQSDIDDIEIRHAAKGREGFASGAILAGEFLQGKQGVFGMKDLLQF